MKRLPARLTWAISRNKPSNCSLSFEAARPRRLRLRAHLPAAAGQPDAAIAAMGLRLHDAQSCLAREYGFVSWAELAGFVSMRSAHASDPARGLLHWLSLVYAGDIAGGMNRAQPTTPGCALCGLAQRGTIYHADASNRDDDDFSLQAHRWPGQQVSIPSPEMLSRRICLPIELRKTARKS